MGSPGEDCGPLGFGGHSSPRPRCCGEPIRCCGLPNGISTDDCELTCFSGENGGARARKRFCAMILQPRAGGAGPRRRTLAPKPARIALLCRLARLWVAPGTGSPKIPHSTLSVHNDCPFELPLPIRLEGAAIHGSLSEAQAPSIRKRGSISRNRRRRIHRFSHHGCACRPWGPRTHPRQPQLGQTGKPGRHRTRGRR